MHKVRTVRECTRVREATRLCTLSAPHFLGAPTEESSRLLVEFMSSTSLHPFVYTQETNVHIRIGKKFQFLMQIGSLLGDEILRAVVTSPIPFIFPVVKRDPVWEVFIYILL